MITIGITGTLGAGKGTVVEYLKTQGFRHYSVRAFLTEEIKLRALPVNRDSMTEVANNLRAVHSPSYIAEELYKRAQAAQEASVIESLRNPDEVKALRAEGSFYLLAVDARQELRYERIRQRANETDQVSFAEFQANEQREMSSKETHKQNIAACMALADYTLRNDGTFDDLHEQIDKVLEDIQGKS